MLVIYLLVILEEMKRSRKKERICQSYFTTRRLKTNSRVICIAGGEKKVTGLLTAIENKYISGLITDTYTANELINLLQKKEIKEDV